MPNSDIIRNNVMLAEHHVEDALETDNKAVVQSSVKDLGEIVENLKKALPPKDKAAMPTEVEQKIAAAQQRDANLAFQLGFAKEAALHDLDAQETAKLYAFALQKLAAGCKSAPSGHSTKPYTKGMKIAEAAGDYDPRAGTKPTTPGFAQQMESAQQPARKPTVTAVEPGPAPGASQIKEPKVEGPTKGNFDIGSVFKQLATTKDGQPVSNK